MKNLCWLRRDLRLHDHAALSNALGDGPTLVAFIFDPHILEKLENKADRRVSFIYESLQELEKELQKKGSSLIIRYGKPEEEIPNLCTEFEIKKVFTNRDYEPYAKKRDELVARRLKALNIEFNTSKDSVIFEKHEVLTDSHSIYKVFTPYKNKWLEKFESTGRNVSFFSCDLKKLAPLENKKNILDFDWYKEIGFTPTTPPLSGGTKAAHKRLKDFKPVMENYKVDRDFPAIDGTSLLSVYIRFGNISIREMVGASLEERSEGASTWLSELIWRDFYQMILDAYPKVEKTAFKPQYDQIKWLGGKEEFDAWAEGRTGFPIVDAAMRCFNQTGMMHNRLRMVVASFLCKILLVDWRLGERYFAENLLDFDLAANNGGWQWSSSSGCDAQPYFRIFNPYNQSEKFDGDGEFIKTWIPELSEISGDEIHRPDVLKNRDYPAPIVSYEKNRKRCLEMYSAVRET